jgi:acyl carrier protein
MILSQEAIFNTIRDVLKEHFEIDNKAITLNANLYDDLDIDSIDAVNLIIELKSLAGRKIQLEELQKVKTVGDVVTVIQNIQTEMANKG